MYVKQLSVFVENKVGRLAEITGILGAKSINIQAMSIADTTDFGILRLIVDDPQAALETLKDKGLTVKETEVVAVCLDNSPGALSNVLQKLFDNDISIEYIYDFAFAKPVDESTATIVMRLNDQAAAAEKLRALGFKLIGAAEVQK